MYTREAHPGDAFPGHESLEHKVSHARDMVRRLAIRRPMLVDDLAGTVHTQYGALPNMSWIVNRGGRVVYKADWTDPRTIEIALEGLIYERDQRRSRTPMTPYYVEWLPQRPNSQQDFLQGLLDVPGPRAAKEFLDAIAARAGEDAVARLREWLQSQAPGTRQSGDSD